MTIEDLKKKSVTELKALAFDLNQERELISNSINIVLNEIAEKQRIEAPAIKEETPKKK